VRAAVLVEPGRVEVRDDYPDPVPCDGDVVVDVELCGICGSDLMDWYVAQKVPAVLGHEIVGRVTSVTGAARERLTLGQRVFVHHHVPCGRCRYCERGFETLCSGFKASRILPGGFAQQVLVPAAHVDHGVLPLPAHVDSETATLIEPLACALRGIARARVRKGDRALVVGLGQMGQLYGRALVAKGVETVGTDPVVARVAAARRAGIDALEADRSPTAVAADRPFDLIALCTGSLDALALGLTMAGKATVIQLFAPPRPGQQATFDPGRLFFNEITVQASYSAGPADTRAALDLLSGSEAFGVGMVSGRYPLADIETALAVARSGGEVLKVVVATA